MMRRALPLAILCLSAAGRTEPWARQAEGQAPASKPEILPRDRPWSDAIQRFDNGFELLIEPVKGSKAMGLFFFVKSGWNMDPLDRTGLAHFVEHMVMTAGTPCRKDGWQYGDWVKNRKHGANAMTRSGWTLYFSMGTREECSSDARWFKEILDGKAEFHDAQLERERERMQSEVTNMTLYRPGGILQWRARSLLLKGAPGRVGIGLAPEVEKVVLDDIRSQTARTHHAGNVLCIAVGRVHADRDLPFYKDLFGGLEGRASPEAPPWKPVAKIAPVIEHPNVGAVFGTLAFPAPEPDSAAYPAYLLAASWLMQRAMVERKPRGKQIQGMFFPAQYSYLEGPELFLLNLRGTEEQSTDWVQKELLRWLDKKRKSRIGWVHLRSSQSSLRFFFPPHPLERRDLGMFAATPRSLYRLGLSRGVSILSRIPTNLPTLLSKVPARDVEASLTEWFATDRGRFLALRPRKGQK